MHNTQTLKSDPYVKDTPSLIASDKVDGTAVYGSDDGRIGSIKRIILEKRGGRVAYAVLSFGGFLGVGDDHYPLPWSALTYDTNLGGYVTNVDRARLDDAPRYTADEDAFWTDPRQSSGIDRHWISPVM